MSAPSRRTIPMGRDISQGENSVDVSHAFIVAELWHRRLSGWWRMKVTASIFSRRSSEKVFMTFPARYAQIIVPLKRLVGSHRSPRYHATNVVPRFSMKDAIPSLRTPLRSSSKTERSLGTSSLPPTSSTASVSWRSLTACRNGLVTKARAN